MRSLLSARLSVGLPIAQSRNLGNSYLVPFQIRSCIPVMKLVKNLVCVITLVLVFTALSTRANVIFNLIPEPGTPQFAIDGFTSAANRWSTVLANNVTINVQIGFSSLGQFVIGQTSSDFREYTYLDTLAALGTQRTSLDDFSSHAALQPGESYTRLINRTSNNPNGVNSAVPYVDSMNRVGMTTANAKALGLLGPTATADGLIRFNSDFAFDFDPLDGITSGQFDFVGVATHELGHALGFISGVDDIDQLGGVLPGDAFSSNLLDLFRYSTESFALGFGVTDYTADTRAKYFSVDGGSSQIALFANGLVNGDGRQASHWKDFFGIGLMDPTAARGELMVLTDTDLRAFDVLGYTLVPEPGAGAFLLLFGLLWRRNWPSWRQSLR
jgi:hypothetical protein